MLALGVLIGGGLALGLLAGWHSQSAAPRPAPPLPAAPHPAAVRPRPAEAPTAAHSPAPRGAEPGTGTAPRVAHEASPPSEPASPDHPVVAVIFDDAGYNLRTAEEVIALPRPVTISVLPQLPF